MKKLERTRNAYRNIITGSILKLIQIAVPFIVRTIMIRTLGMEYLGLNSLFASVLQVLNLAELGVGSAMVFSMYKPIAEDDTDTICALMNLYRKYYRIIGMTIMVIGLMIMPFLRHLINGTVPEGINIHILYLIHLFATVLSYWLFAYKNSLLIAYQRLDISNKVAVAIQLIQNVLQIVVLVIWKNYYFYIIIMPIVQIVSNCMTALIVNKVYPQYKPKGKLGAAQVKTINGKIRDLFTSKIGSVVLNSADSIVISAFLGLNILAIYNNYYYILSSVIGFITIIFQSITAGIGNSMVTETKEKNYRDFEKMSFLLNWIIGVCCACFVSLYQPFMQLWAGEENMLSMVAVVMLTVYFYIYEMNGLLNIFKDAAGMWHEDRFRSLVVAIANLVMNIAAVRFIGIYGVILSTILSLSLIGIPWITKNLFTHVFSGRDIMQYLGKTAQYVLKIVCVTVITFAVCRLYPDDVLGLIFRGITCTILPNACFVILYYRTKEFTYIREMLPRILKGGR